jgi:hypothetical protein
MASTILVLALPVLAAAPSFTEKPTVVRGGDGATISFAVSTETDVDVAIFDAKGVIVRHLVAGKLGKNAPAPLAMNALKQQVVWDGKDNLGRKAAGGPFQVRVGLGVTPKFDRMIADNPGTLGGVNGFAVGPKGELFVLHNHGSIHPDDNSGFCSVFDRDGKYMRTILPYSSQIPADKLSGVRQVRLESTGETVPFLYNAELRTVVPGTGQFILHQPVATRDGRFVFIGHQEVVGTMSRYNGSGVRQIVTINSDGSIPAGGPLRTILAKSSQCGGSLAVAPDDKTFYACGISDGGGKARKDYQCVFKFSLEDKEPKPFIGAELESGTGKDRLNNPKCVVVDGQGNLFVSDSGNNRVAVFQADGTFLAEIPLQNPDRIAVNRKTGTIYVTAGEKDHTLYKFESFRSAKPVCEMKVPFFVKGESRDATLLAVDDSAAPAIVYYGTARSQYLGNFKVLRIEDKGSAFGEGLALGKVNGPDEAGQMLMLTMDRVHNKLYFDEKVYDVASGKIDVGLGKVVKYRDSISGVGTKGGNGAVGLDGMMYLMGYSAWMKRFDTDMKMVGFEDGTNGVFHNGNGGGSSPDAPGSLRLRARGITADPNGNIYALWQSAEKNASNYLAMHAPSGKMVKNDVVASCMRGLESVRLDYQGNIYLMVSVRPRGVTVPSDFAGEKMPPGWKYSINSHEMNWYEMLYGCMVKFGPKGGAIVSQPEAGQKMEYGLPSKKTLVGIQDAQWSHFGASPAASWRHPYPDCCDCEAAQFDVDGFGRSFYPDAGRFRVGMLDTAGNDLGSFGSYGNQDETGKDGRIPMYWPYCIAVDNNDTVYVGDRLNRRVIVVKLMHQVREIVAIN